MKKFLTFIAFFAAMTMSSCMYDDTFVVNSISDLQKRVNALEQLQNASEQGLLIESVTEFEGGYVVKFSDGSEITLYHGTNGKDGVDGMDGVNGTNGKDGADGKDGVDGKAGAPGADGKDGIYGKDGADGKDGENGADGINGTNGITPKHYETIVSTYSYAYSDHVPVVFDFILN